MKNLTYLVLALVLALTACANNVVVQNGASQWDFDHQVQFKQTELQAGKYYLQVIAKPDVEFSQLSTFLMRKALRLCKSYGFSIEVLAGIEGVDDKLSFPNMITPSLSANITCPKP
ncbi:MAG: hypothetical protein ACPG52_04205 [Cognaticolwellia sp.]